MHASSALSVGGIQQNFGLKENMEMAAYGAEFIRNARKHLNVFDSRPIDIGYQPQGNLQLASLAQSSQLVENVARAVSNNHSRVLLDKVQLKQQFPWLFVGDDVAVGSLEMENEGWFDPFALLVALRNKAVSLGVDYLEAELLDFNLHRNAQTHPNQIPVLSANHAIVRTAEGHLKQIQFARAIITAGPDNAEICEMLKIGKSSGLLATAAPFKKRKRYYYAFESMNGPGLDFPLLIDPSGVFVRRDGFGGNFVAGKCPTEEEEEIDNNNFDVDYRYFEKRIAPILKSRVPSFSDLKLLRGWASFEDVNTFDQQPIIGRHPHYHNVFLAGGLGVHSIQMAPAVGLALQELIMSTRYKTLDLTALGWNRLETGIKLQDNEFAQR